MSLEAKTELVRLLVEAVVRGLVDEPDEVRVGVNVGTRVVVLSVEVAREDVGRAVGARGAYMNLLGKLLTPIGFNHQIRYVLDRIQ
ncbi:KH domain-containing protein [Candidatus Uhrbacteria bacterium]|nr:KH domain-containing protein [Candidatus Uhrbacteria bacterium]